MIVRACMFCRRRVHWRCRTQTAAHDCLTYRERQQDKAASAARYQEMKRAKAAAAFEDLKNY